MHKGLLILGSLLAMIAVGIGCDVSHAADEAWSPRVVGYDTVAPGGNVPDADKLDVVVFAFAQIKHGKLVLPGDAPARLRKLLELKTVNPKLKVMVSVGGWGAGGFSGAARTDASRKAFAESAARLLVRTHTDGLDVDWEYPGSSQAGIRSSPHDRAHFTALIETLRKTLDRVGPEHGHTGTDPYLLTIASADSQYVQGIDLAAVAPYLDWFNVMTYDFNNSLTKLTGNHAGLYASAVAPGDARTTERAVRQYLAAGIPADKIVIGVAFYGRRFKGVRSKHHGLYQPYESGGDFVPWSKLKSKFLDHDGYVRHWDRHAQAAYLWNAGTHEFISYDDPESIAAKAAYVKAGHLGGIMFWQAGDDARNQLLDAVWNDLR